jgi:hypothetical protein
MNSRLEYLEVYKRSISLILRHLIHVLYSSANQKNEISLDPQKLLEYLASVTDGPLEAVSGSERVLISAILVGYSKSFYEQTYNYVKNLPIDLEEFNIEFNTKDTYDFIKSVKSIRKYFNSRVDFSDTLNKLVDIGFISKHKAFSHVQSLGRTYMIILSPQFVQDFYSKYYLSHMAVEGKEINIADYVGSNIAKITLDQGVIEFGKGSGIGEFIEFCSKFKKEWDRQGIPFYKAVTIALLCSEPKGVFCYVKNNCYRYLHLLDES